MNIFILSTGRCGSTTFIEACKHIQNYTCAHESRTSMLGEERLNYPERHIEADNRLSWLLGRLENRYGDSAFYVHLKRNESDTARSYAKRYSRGIMKAYKGDGILMGLSKQSDPALVSLDYCNTVNSNIEHFLKTKSKRMTVELETIEADFRRFWNMIGAQGEIDAALAELKIKYNETKIETEVPAPPKKTLLEKIVAKARRLATKFPAFIKNA